MDVGAVDIWGNDCNYEHLGLQQEEQWEWSEPQQDPWMSVQEVSVEEKVSAFDAWAAAGFGDMDINAVLDRSHSICYNCNQKGHISPSVQREKEKGKTRAREKGEKDSREKVLASTSPREIGK